MKPPCRWVFVSVLGAALFLGAAAATWASPQEQQQQQAKPNYTLAEYNAYQAAHNEKDPQMRLKDLDDFVSKYPSSALLLYVYGDYYQTYYALKNYPKTIEYVDKLLALPDLSKPEQLGTKLQALGYRAQAMLYGSGDKGLQTPDAYTKAKDAAGQGLQVLSQWQKPQGMADDQFAKNKNGLGVLFNSVAGIAESGLKDYKAAADSYKAVLALDPSDPVTHFRLGVAYLEEMPPNDPDGLWELARSIALKGPGEAQVRTYLRNQLLHYQQPSCDKLADDEINQMITLAGTATDRPASLAIPSADDLQKARDDTANFLPWLQEGGQHGQVMWLATCGLEYPDVGVKVLDIMPADNDNFTLMVYRPAAADPDAAEKEMDAATMPNMTVHIVGQPDVKRLMKDDAVRFTGTLTGYQQSPFMLTWDNGKVNAEDLQPAPSGGKRPARSGGARPGATPKKPAQ
jgi:tetratricopeptide (TPR) repeat protein